MTSRNVERGGQALAETFAPVTHQRRDSTRDPTGLPSEDPISVLPSLELAQTPLAHPLDPAVPDSCSPLATSRHARR